MGKALDITGERYGRLVAMTNTGKKALRNFIWKFKCDCGNVVEKPASEVRRGSVSSCGCLSKEVALKKMKKIQSLGSEATRTHGMTNTPTFVSWGSMKQRCLNKNHKSYSRYGGRGISVCERWLNSFENFYKDMGARPKDTTLDRIDNDGNYEPNNCRWATSEEQGGNKQTSKLITHLEKTQSAIQWAREFKIPPKTFLYRINNGWGIEEALSMKVNHGNSWKRGSRSGGDLL